MKKISIIVTCYNHEEYIAQCLKSIYNQTYSNLELVVINDGSTDDSDLVIKNILLESPFETTHYISRENKGVCYSRNEGLDWVTGDYVLIVDSDNFLENNHVELCVEELEKSGLDIAYCSQKNAVTGGIVNEVPEFSLGRLISANYIDTCSLIRVSKIEDTRFDLALTGRSMEDYDFFLSLVTKGAKPIKIQNLYLNYRLSKGSMNNRAENHLKRIEWIETYQYIIGKYPQYVGTSTSLLGDWYLSLNNDYNLNAEKFNERTEKLKLALKEKEITEKKLADELKELTLAKQQVDQQFVNLNQQYLNVVNSKSWLIGRVLTHPYRKALSLKSKILNRLGRRRPTERIQESNYQKWINEFERQESEEVIREDFKYRPLISILIPVYNVEKKWLLACVESILNQTYSNWELCLADDASTNQETIQTLEELSQLDSRIKVVFREENGHISAATNSALQIAEGEFIALVDNDDTLPKQALCKVVEALNKNKNLNLIYSDEDKITEDGKRYDPHFKPDWAPNLILNQNYVSHLGVYRRSIASEIGGFRVGFEGAQDHDFLLRFIEKIDEKTIHHIPEILYHWRAISGSTALQTSEKSYVEDRGILAVQEALNRRKIPAHVSSGKYPGLYEIEYLIPEKSLVSIIIPTRNGYEDLKQCVDSIIELSTYENYEIIIADNGSDDEKMAKLFSSYKEKLQERFKVVLIDIPFNYSRINNLAVEESKGKYLLFLNNDTSVITPSWIEEMVGLAQFDNIGCVGAKLWYMDDTIQHGGVVLGIGGIAGHAFLNASPNDPGYFSRLYTNYNYTAVTAACLMVKRVDFDAVGGFDEKLTVAFNDVDFCIKVYKLGRYNVWAHKAELYHYESKSRGQEDTPEKKARFKKEIDFMNQRYGCFLENDPAYNINFDLYATPFSRLGRKNIN